MNPTDSFLTQGLDECAPDPAVSLPSTTRSISWATNATDLADNQITWPSISRNQRYVSFVSFGATNIMPGISGPQTFVYDVATSSLELLSAKDDGTPGNAASTDGMAGLSCSGRYAVFSSMATNLTTDVVSGAYAQLFWKDRETGEVRLVSKRADGTVADDAVMSTGFAAASRPFVSNDGRFVIFTTAASNLDGTGATNWKILQKDMMTGTVSTISAKDDGTPLDGINFDFDVSSDGNRVVFSSDSGNINASPAGRQQIYVKNISTGTLTLLSKTPLGAPGDDESTSVRISGNGRYVGFISKATDLVTGYASGVSSSAYRVSLATGYIEAIGPAAGAFCCDRKVGISYDGNIVSWLSAYVPAFYNRVAVVAKNLSTGSTVLVSKSDMGVVADNPQGPLDLSGDGKWAAFQGLATNLVAPAANNWNWQLYTLPTGF